MCLIFLALKQHPEYKLVVAANRDEFYNRKTAAADFWTDHQNILAGRDLEAGGTWLGVNKSGKVSMITNYRDPKNIDPNAPSRGHLVSDFLASDETSSEYIKKVEAKGRLYNGFNLVTGTSEALHYYSNYRNGVTELTSGLFGLSNHLLETPWPKVIRGKQRMAEALQNSFLSKEKLFDVLFDDLTAADNLLPDTGIGLERERALSSMFIKSPGYGTRCSTVILIDNKNNLQFTERVFNLVDFSFGERSFSFAIDHNVAPSYKKS